MAQLEHKYGIKASYYFRYPKTFDMKVMNEIYDLGHEIGYHYEVLDKTGGDCDKAVVLFQKELNVFRESFPVRTACMHGNPLTKWDGRDIWKTHDYRDYGIIGEAFLSFDHMPIYLTDTGRNWNGDNNIKDKIAAVNRSRSSKSTADVIGFINCNTVGSIYLNCHPERWGHGLLDWTAAYFRDLFFNICKKVLKLCRFCCKLLSGAN
jgi:hypothetical protein